MAPATGKCENYLQTARKISPPDYLVLIWEYAGSSEGILLKKAKQSQNH